jgi:hypothetical protein
MVVDRLLHRYFSGLCEIPQTIFIGTEYSPFYLRPKCFYLKKSRHKRCLKPTNYETRRYTWIRKHRHVDTDNNLRKMT